MQKNGERERREGKGWTDPENKLRKNPKRGQRDGRNTIGDFGLLEAKVKNFRSK